MTPKDVQSFSVSLSKSSTTTTMISSSSSSLSDGDLPPQRRHRQRLDIPTMQSSSSSSSSSSFSFGVIADVQWADEPDGYNYAKTVKRCYRGAFTTLQNAVQWWNEYNSLADKPPLQFIAQLGDLIDGLNQHKKQQPEGERESDRVLSLALGELNKIVPSIPSVNLVGNHELYNFNRQQLSKVTWLQDGNEEYYSFEPAKGWKIIVLDPYQISLIGHSEDDPRRLEAVQIISKENPNVKTDGSAGDWFGGIEGYQRRFCPYNGGFGKQQLEWLQEELQEAIINQQRVLIFSHVIIHPKACGGGTMAWDYDQALNIIHQSKVRRVGDNKDDDDNDDDNENGTCSVVAAILCGHDHKGNYYCDDMGIHHCTFSSPLNKGDDGYAFGLIKVNTPDGYMEIMGPKMDDFLPNINGQRPTPTTTNEYESLRLPIVNNKDSWTPSRPPSETEVVATTIPVSESKETTIK